MAFTAAQLNAIEAAIGTGELTVSFEGKTVTYRSMSELKAARDLIRAVLIESGVIADDANPRRSYACFDKR